MYHITVNVHNMQFWNYQISKDTKTEQISSGHLMWKGEGGQKHN